MDVPTIQITFVSAAHCLSSLGSVPTQEGILPTGGRLSSVVRSLLSLFLLRTLQGGEGTKAMNLVQCNATSPYCTV